MTQNVVITGASAGIGRATAQLFGKRGANVALVARGAAGLQGAARRRRGRRRQGADHPDRCRRLFGRRSRRRPSRIRIRPHRRLGQCRVHLRLRAIQRNHGRRVQTRHRGVLPRVRPRHHGGAGENAAPRPRHHRAGRLGTQPAIHPAAVGLLRRQTRHQRVHRIGALRTAARGIEGADHPGADARGQHPPVLLGAVPPAAASPAGTADLPARSRRPRRPLRRRPSGAQAVLGRRQHRGHAHRAEVRRTACSTATWAAPDTTPSRPTSA